MWSRTMGVAMMGSDVASRVPELARAAERAGLGSVWFVEDYFFPGVFALAGAALGVTERITVGLGVVNPYTRHPALIAMETASLASLAPGRVVLGLGTSNRNWIEGRMAIPFTTPLASLRECVEIVRRLLAGERLTYHGERHTVEAVELEDVRDGLEVPIVLGVKGPKALGLAADVADGVHGAILTSPAHVRRIRASARGHRAARFSVVAYVPVAVSADGDRARAWVRPLIARYLGVLHGQSILADAGLERADTQAFRDALAAGKPAAELVTDEVIDTLAVAGTPAECRDALARWHEAGLDAPIAVVPGAADLRAQIEAIGAELAPCWARLGLSHEETR
ncbi:MAG: LLM class flavin-dependent oxidoreductase [Candidatus Rokubacteria bacterium]|nr:LLM class flavin-dependent oxidoreductase [Candidatus Rokubacteria bacterium]